jgi:hypothetical protein
MAILAAAVLRDHTQYAPGFSEVHFGLVVPGMSEESVVALLGPPFSEHTGFPETWEYPIDGSIFRRFGAGELVQLRYIVFEASGRVGDVGDHLKERVSLGMTVGEVLDALGPPKVIHPAFKRRAWYSRQVGNFGRYSIRTVLYDENSRVVGKESRWDRD